MFEIFVFTRFDTLVMLGSFDTLVMRGMKSYHSVVFSWVGHKSKTSIGYRLQIVVFLMVH